ncbi:MAG: hypothetical protein IJX51_05945 [Clostridia bacterium]|nr:hypothetical protein [Clostridia bacterium]
MKKRRKDSFFGIHLDYHAKPEDGMVQGKNLRREDIQKICKLLKPDFIQIDCKGHPGWASYPTKIGNAMPKFEMDTLSLWREVTEEEGVALYMHYSGVYDVKYCNEHPDEEIIRADGLRVKGSTRLNGNYSRDILIPQLLELAEVYKVDGVWVDGDCWMACADFRPESLAEFERDTGIDLKGNTPKSPSDPYYQEYREYHRELFRRYLRNYVDTVHSTHPDFQIASNWAFSDHMPEEVSANVDFLSGDLNPSNSFNSARYAARALAQQEHPWDLMSWNFRNSLNGRKGYTPKHPVQIMQEASSVMAMGGAFQNYVVQNKDGSPNMRELEKMAEVSEFIRKRKDFCFRGKPMHQAALLLSTYDRHMEAMGLYSRTGYERIMGLTSLLCDIGQSLEIVCEHTLEKYMDEYKMIVVPELFCGLDKKTVESLYAYAERGGRLVLVGKNTCKIFAGFNKAPYSVTDMQEYINEKIEETENGHGGKSTGEYKPYLFTVDGNEYGALYSPCEIIGGVAEAYAFERYSETRLPVSSTVPYGKGSITPIGFDVGLQYLSAEQYLHRSLMNSITNKLYTPVVKVSSALGRLEIVVLDKDGKLMIQLVNGNGSHGNQGCATDDMIPPVLDIMLSVRTATPPKELILQPQGKALPFEYKNGASTVSVDRVDIHNIIEVRS